jgi:hypothetical protein
MGSFRYEAGRYEAGRYEAGRYEAGRHETGRYETGRYEAGIRVGGGRAGAGASPRLERGHPRHATLAVPRDSLEVPCGLSYRGPPYRV